MHVAILPLIGSLAIGGPPGPSAPGILPVPGMGPPGAVAAFGAMVPPAVPRPAAPLPQPAPLVAAKVLAPRGVRVTAFPGTRLARIYDTPTVFGLRPGYVYRFELANLPYHPNVSLFPEVELRGVLVPRPGMKYMDFPIPLKFSLVDIEHALAGAVVTKVIYLEDPDKAIPAEIPADTPVEVNDDTETLALKNARESGRLMAIIRLGDRRPPVRELAAVAIEGTILMPGEKYLRTPVAPPVFPFWGVPLFDPILGPRGPKEECFDNGDDKKNPLGIGLDNKLGGLEPTDVGVEYTTDGKRKVTTSNMVCLCSPRYGIRRAELLSRRVRGAARAQGPSGGNPPFGVPGTHGNADRLHPRQGERVHRGNPALGLCRADRHIAVHWHDTAGRVRASVRGESDGDLRRAGAVDRVPDAVPADRDEDDRPAGGEATRRGGDDHDSLCEYRVEGSIGHRGER